jgi:hypothetical protein
MTDIWQYPSCQMPIIIFFKKNSGANLAIRVSKHLVSGLVLPIDRSSVTSLTLMFDYVFSTIIGNIDK